MVVFSKNCSAGTLRQARARTKGEARVDFRSARHNL
jgi:hypothetical protein